jgi:hypothetical protein
MTTQVTATFTNGVLKPDGALPLADQARVKLTIEPLADATRVKPTIEPVEEWSAAGALATWNRIQARLKHHPIDGGGVRYLRDELHERR